MKQIKIKFNNSDCYFYNKDDWKDWFLNESDRIKLEKKRIKNISSNYSFLMKQ